MMGTGQVEDGTTKLGKMAFYGCVFLQSIVLGIRPYTQQDFVDQMDVYKRPEPFPYSQQSYCFVLEELPIVSFARV